MRSAELTPELRFRIPNSAFRSGFVAASIPIANRMRPHPESQRGIPVARSARASEYTTCETPACRVSSGDDAFSVPSADTLPTIDHGAPRRSAECANGCLVDVGPGTNELERAGNSLRALQQHQMGTAPTADHLCLA